MSIIPPNHFSTSFRPRFRDTDRVGHVNNAVFATYFENCRIEWSHKSKEQGKVFGLRFILARIEVDYIKPILLEDVIRVSLWVSRIGNKSWTFDYLIQNENDGSIHAKGKSVQVIFDYNLNASQPLTDEAKKFLSELYNE